MSLTQVTQCLLHNISMCGRLFAVIYFGHQETTIPLDTLYCEEQIRQDKCTSK